MSLIRVLSDDLIDWNIGQVCQILSVNRQTNEVEVTWDAKIYELLALQARVKELEEMLLHYGVHKLGTCEKYRKNPFFGVTACTCGWTEICVSLNGEE